MRIPKYLIALTLLLAAAAPARSEGLKDWAMDLLHRFNKPKTDIDTTLFFQMKPRWFVSATGTGRQLGVEQINRFTVGGTPSVLTLGLNERLYTGTGVNVGYGAVSLGFSTEIGRKSAQKNRLLGYSYFRDRFGADIQYCHIRQPLSCVMTLGSEGDADFSESRTVSSHPGEMRVILADLFYALNRNSFSFQAAYRPGKVQKRTAGSWLLGAKYLQGETRLDPEDPFAVSMDHLSRHRTGQLSFGGGYSLNLVLFNRLRNQEEKTLRNLTLNVTALPMLTYYNKLTFHRTVFKASGQPDGDALLSKTFSPPRINYMTRMGLCYIHGRFYATLTGEYDSFVMKGTARMGKVSSRVGDVRMEALFHKWTTTLCLNYRF